jgi:hypothetical protein
LAIDDSRIEDCRLKIVIADLTSDDWGLGIGDWGVIVDWWVAIEIAVFNRDQ